MAEPEILLLGPPRFRREGELVDLRPAKAAVLLAYLAARDSPQSRDVLADLLWPDSLPDAARKNLRNTLWAIRQALGDELLVQVGADRLDLSPGARIDTRLLEAAAGSRDVHDLATAAALYRGPFLDGLAFSGAPDLEIWLVAARERFRQSYLRLLAALLAAHRAAGDWAAVREVADRALAADDLQEPAYRALMEAHARLGNRVEALRVYDRLHAILAHHLGVEPLPETTALRDEIAADALPPSSSLAPSPVVAVHGAAGRNAGGQPQFVGRSAELAALDQELATASAGSARVVLLTGELGIGKSRLWQEWARTLSPPALALATRCLDMARLFPFAPLTSLFSQALCLERLASPPAPLPGIWLSELSRIIPHIRDRWPAIPPPSPVPPEEERRRLFEAFTQALLALGGRPLVLFLDDLHWADSATLDWLVYLVDRMAAGPFLLVAAYRPGDAPLQVERMAATWQRRGVARRLALARLTPAEAAELAAALGLDPALAEPLHARSAGNPYFLIELGRAGPGDLPPGLADLVRVRLATLPAAARQVLQAAAVLGGDFDLATLRRTSGRGEEETLDALDALLDARVLAEEGARYDFVHPLVAAVVRDELSIARRSFLHRRAAEALEADHRAALAPLAATLAHHFAQAGRPEQAANYAEMAGDHALSLAAPAEAVAFYRQAVSHHPTGRRVAGLGRALALRGDLPAARDLLSSAVQDLEAAGDPDGVARVALALAETYLPSGQGDLARRWADRALHSAGAGERAELVASAHYLLGAGGLQAGASLAQAEAHLTQAATLAAGTDVPEVAARSRFELGNLFAQRGDLPQAIDAFETAISLARAAGLRFIEVLGHNNLAYHAHLAGDMDSARSHVEAGLALAGESSLLLPYQYLYSTRGEIALAEGQLDEAEAWLERALAEAGRHDNRVQVATVRANLGRVAQRRGDLARAAQQLADALALADETPDLYLRCRIALWLAGLHLDAGDLEAAAQVLHDAQALLAGSEYHGLRAQADQLRSRLAALRDRRTSHDR